MKKIWIYMVLTVLILVCTGCIGKKVNNEEKKVVDTVESAYTFNTFQVQLGDVLLSKQITCIYQYAVQQNLSFALEGSLVEDVYVKAGDFVEKGQLLATLDIEDKEEMIPDMEYEIKQLELKLSQEKELLQFDLASADLLFSYTKETSQDKEALVAKKEEINKNYKYSLEDYEDQLVTKKSRLEEYKTMVQGGKIYAPFRGEISYVLNGLKGSYTEADTVAIRIGEENSSCFVSTDKEQASSFEKGEIYLIETKYPSGGSTFRITPTLFDTWGDELYFSLVDEGDLVSSGTTGYINQSIDEAKDVIRIPIEALHSTGDTYFVYVLKNENREMQYVDIGLVGDEFVEITNGIEIGTRVVLD